ncbi:hypothetical protein D8S78_00405 [Natrialba swarupiae]|nr:hypothetical protein [Natrialba swarupiae]
MFRSSIVATERHCTPDRQTDRRSVCTSVQLLLSPERECRRFRPIAVLVTGVRRGSSIRRRSSATDI